jgi:hypothetical protein
VPPDDVAQRPRREERAADRACAVQMEEGMRRISKAVLMVVIMLGACAACTSSPPSPSEEDGKALLLQKLDRIFVPPFSIESFAKTGTQSKSESGVELFQMDFTAVVTYPGNDILCVYAFCPQFNDQDLHALFDKAKKTVAITGRLTFEKTQNGWAGRL